MQFLFPPGNASHRRCRDNPSNRPALPPDICPPADLNISLHTHPPIDNQRISQFFIKILLNRRKRPGRLPPGNTAASRKNNVLHSPSAIKAPYFPRLHNGHYNNLSRHSLQKYAVARHIVAHRVKRKHLLDTVNFNFLKL